MAQTTNIELRELRDLIARGTEANTKAISDLTLEMRVGFANIDTKFAKLEGKIDNLETKLFSTRGYFAFKTHSNSRLGTSGDGSSYL
jgi:hypothetical protein